MGKGFWIRRFVIALVIAWAVLFAAHLLRGHALADSAWFAALWGAAAAVIFTVIGYVKYRRNPACMLPRSRQP